MQVKGKAGVPYLYVSPCGHVNNYKGNRKSGEHHSKSTRDLQKKVKLVQVKSATLYLQPVTQVYSAEKKNSCATLAVNSENVSVALPRLHVWIRVSIYYLLH